MTDVTPNPKTLDLGAVLAGVAYPKDTVEVWLDEATAYEISKADKAIKRAELMGDAELVEKLEEQREKLVELGASSRLVFHLTGVSRRVKEDILSKTDEKFKPEYSIMGTRMPNRQADEYHANLRWAVHVEKFVASDGSELVAPGPESIERFRAVAPAPASDAIENAINDLSDGAKSGFESLAQEHGFLSQPSPEA